MVEKRYIIYAGVNGAGKSTLHSIHKENRNRINPDEILKSMGFDWRDKEAQKKAGITAIKKFDEFIKLGVSFNQETTLTGNIIKRNIKRAKSEGYKIELEYVGVDNVEIAKERIKARVNNGGHGIPDVDVERRYSNSLKQLKEILPLCDRVTIYNNTRVFELITEITNGLIEIRKGYRKTKWIQGILDDKIAEQIKNNIIKSGFRPNSKIINQIRELQLYYEENITVERIKDMAEEKSFDKEVESIGKDLVKGFLHQQRSHFPER